MRRGVSDARDWRSMPREEAIALIMRERNVDRLQAKFILALVLGETTGDAHITKSPPPATEEEERYDGPPRCRA